MRLLGGGGARRIRFSAGSDLANVLGAARERVTRATRPTRVLCIAHPLHYTHTLPLYPPTLKYAGRFARLQGHQPRDRRRAGVGLCFSRSPRSRHAGLWARGHGRAPAGREERVPFALARSDPAR